MSAAPKKAYHQLIDELKVAMTEKDTAVALLNNGLRPVPLHVLGSMIPDGKGNLKQSKGKEPAGGKSWGIKLWTKDELAFWYAGHQGSGVGILLGPSGGVFAIDRDGPGANEAFIELCEGEEPDTLEWLSRRGKGCVFLYDQRLAEIAEKYNRGGKISIGNLEIRFGAKQLHSAIPPTLGEDGKRRVWTNFAPIASIPECFFRNLEGYLEGSSRQPQEQPTTIPIRPSSPSSTWSVEQRVIAYLSKVDPAISGQRGHDQAFKAACKIGPGFGLAPDQAYTLLSQHFNPKCQPPWSEKELRHKVEEAYKVETRRGWILNQDRNPPPGKPTFGNSNGNGDGANEDGGDNEPPNDDGRPMVIISTDEHVSIREASEALSTAPDLYSRGPMLVDVFETGDGTPRIWVTPYARLRTSLTERALVCEHAKHGPRPIHPPDWLVRGILDRGFWPELRSLEAITESPVLRPDGTILDEPGYDAKTRLLYIPNHDYPRINPNPNHDDAKAAASRLMDLVSDFPFQSSAHQAAWLAGCLTPFARPAIEGPTPLFLFVANCPGTGKTKLCDIVSILISGRDIPRTVYPERDEEMRKRILAILMAGDRLQMIDNIATRFGGAALDSVLTSTTVKDRVLGKSEMSAELPNITTWFASGNNVEIYGDLMRRVITSRLVTAVERPELRSDFKYPDLLKHVREHRGKLVRDCLTILMAYARLGRPDKRQPLGSYESWSDVVRSAVFWSTGIDPCEGTEELRKTDADTLGREALIKGWSELEDSRLGLTVSQALAKIRGSPDSYATLRGVLMSWSRNDDLPSVQQIGKRLSLVRDRVVEGLRLTSEAYQGIQVWKIVDSVGVVGVVGVPNSPYAYEESKISSRYSSQYTPTTPTTPTKQDQKSDQSEDREEFDL